MTSETSTTLRFLGDWPWWAGTGGALLLGTLAWMLYRRDTQALSWRLRFFLPALRASSVGLMVLMLSGPVLHHRTVVGQLSRLLLFVDGSTSMDLTDPAMELGRKIQISERLGLLREGAASRNLSEAAASLGSAESIAQRAEASLKSDTSVWNGVLTDFAARIKDAHNSLTQAGDLSADQVQNFVQDLVEPSRQIAGREMQEPSDRDRALTDLRSLAAPLAKWRRDLEDAFARRLGGSADDTAAEVKEALQKFDTLPRWQRLQTLLLHDAEEGVLNRLAKTHGVELLVMNGAAATKVWQPNVREPSLPARLPKPSGQVTDLGGALKAALGSEQQATRGAVVVFSDGQHNSGDSPIEIAKVLGGRSMPVHTVGLGSVARPPDLAVLQVDVPESVGWGDRVRGSVILKDDIAPGASFTVAIKDGAKVLWQEQLKTEEKGRRAVSFEFPISDLAQEKLSNQQAGVTSTGVPIEVAVSISSVAGDQHLENNESTIRVRAVTQRRKILLLDGRPRWETRYLRNMFERDEQWEVNMVVASSFARELGLARGNKNEQFPEDFATLTSYDLIILGEVPRAMFKEEELQWIHDFVGKRGGAVAFIDGTRNYLRGYIGTPVEALLPVKWEDGSGASGIARLTLSERAQGLPPFFLLPDAAQNATLWGSLPPPHWVSGATSLLGSEVLVYAEGSSGNTKRMPAVVYRPFGAGKVLYHAFDDSWRWRYEVGDLHHVKYWNQAVNWITEPPFAVRDKFISLDAGAITYQPGESADLRVRLRDGEGRPVADTVVDAVLFRNGQRAATIRLSPDENAGGLFRGRTPALEPGSYQVGVESVAIAARDALARTEFKVEPQGNSEVAQLALDESTLQQMAAVSGGAYLREEQLPQLLDLLAPLSQGRVIESETVLWQSFWWFLPLIALLTIEWILRKRAGLL